MGEGEHKKAVLMFSCDGNDTLLCLTLLRLPPPKSNKLWKKVHSKERKLRHQAFPSRRSASDACIKKSVAPFTCYNFSFDQFMKRFKLHLCNWLKSFWASFILIEVFIWSIFILSEVLNGLYLEYYALCKHSCWECWSIIIGGSPTKRS